MTYPDFQVNFRALTHFGLFEREDDSMDWRAELHIIRTVEKRLSKVIL